MVPSSTDAQATANYRTGWKDCALLFRQGMSSSYVRSLLLGLALSRWTGVCAGTDGYWYREGFNDSFDNEVAQLRQGNECPQRRGT